jgi:Flp pilus assembly protein TadD
MEADALNDEGVDLMDQEDYEEAAEKFRQAIAVKNDDGTFHYNLAVCWENLGRKKDAFREYELAVRLDPGNASAHSSLAAFYMGQGNLDGAIGECHTVIALAPDSDEADQAREMLVEMEKSRG